jgi:hypothetical protein
MYTTILKAALKYHFTQTNNTDPNGVCDVPQGVYAILNGIFNRVKNNVYTYRQHSSMNVDNENAINIIDRNDVKMCNAGIRVRINAEA